MPNSVGNRPSMFDRITNTVTNAVENVANSKVGQLVGDATTYVAEKVDQFDTAAMAAGRALRTKAGARVAGAVTGTVIERLRPGTFDRAGRAVATGAQKLGLNPSVMRGAQNTIAAAAHGAGIVAIGYDAVRSFTDTKADLGSRSAQAAAAVAVGAATFIPGVGTAIVVTDVLTGGGVTGGVKGLVALGDAALTGDRDALKGWVEGAKNGDSGWLIAAAANNKTIARATGVAAEAVISGVGAAKTAVSNAASNVSNAFSSGWRALTAW